MSDRTAAALLNFAADYINDRPAMYPYRRETVSLLWALASAPQASQPPQGAKPWCSCEPTRCEGIGRCRWQAMNYSPLAAPPQGAASPLTDDSAAGSNFEQELRSGGRWSPEMIERVAGAESAIFNAISAYTPPGTHSATASPLPAPQEPAARFLLVAMDDDGCGNPVFCADEKAVRAALAPLLFFFNDEHPLDAENEASIDAHLESLLEDGFLNFEGDPGITLYKLHAAPAPDSTRGTP